LPPVAAITPQLAMLVFPTGQAFARLIGQSAGWIPKTTE
jgi:hypothetical protein